VADYPREAKTHHGSRLVAQNPTDTRQLLSNSREKRVRNNLSGIGPSGASHKWFQTLFSRAILNLAGAIASEIDGSQIFGRDGRRDPALVQPW
jgi:hypothetical protein